MRLSKCKPLIVIALLFAMLLNQPFSSFALVDGNMAHNIYSNPVLTGTSRTYDTFTIDFRAGETPHYTYWALANFNMYTGASKGKYPNISGSMGAYAGLQNTSRNNGRKAIMSFWEVDIGGGEKMRAGRVYPAGVDHDFGGEGEGTNWITPHPWEDNKWYRMVLHCWEDEEMGTTFVGQWFQDIATGKWTLVSYFNTHLIDSYLAGNMSQFMENYSEYNADPERDFNYKNMYVLDHKDGKWKSLSSSRLSFDTWTTFKNKRGSHDFGVASDADGEYFWGKSSGILPEGWDDTPSYDAASRNNVTYSITQPAQPTFGSAAVDGASIVKTENGWQVNWSIADTATPQLSYKVNMYNKKGDLVATKSATRPEVRKAEFGPTDTEMLRCEITVTDVFGNTVTASAQTPSFATLPGDLNEDGEFTVADLSIMLTMLNKGTFTEIADVTGDGALTVKDVSRLLRMLANG